VNERIEELAEQAGAFRMLDTMSDTDPLALLDERIAIFAGLLIKDCANLIDNVFEEGSPPNATIGEQLMRHFGVK